MFVLYLEFFSSDTLVVIIMFFSPLLNALLKNSSFSHLRNEHVSHVTGVFSVLYGRQSKAYSLITSILSSSFARTRHSISSLLSSVSFLYRPKNILSFTEAAANSCLLKDSVLKLPCSFWYLRSRPIFFGDVISDLISSNVPV